MRDRLIELILKSDILCDSCGENSPSYCAEALADYLLVNGVIVPPCKVGDTVFCFDDYYKRITELQFTGIEPVIECKTLKGRRRSFLNAALGKILFLTMEAAEQALKGGDG